MSPLAKRPDGNPNLPSGAYLTPREWAKFGEFIRLEGTWQGEELIPKDLLKACFQPSEASRIYGMTWWLLGRRAKGQGSEGELGRNQRRNRRSANADTLALAVPEDTVAAMGLGKIIATSFHPKRWSSCAWVTPKAKTSMNCNSWQSCFAEA